MLNFCKRSAKDQQVRSLRKRSRADLTDAYEISIQQSCIHCSTDPLEMQGDFSVMLRLCLIFADFVKILSAYAFIMIPGQP